MEPFPLLKDTFSRKSTVIDDVDHSTSTSPDTTPEIKTLGLPAPFKTHVLSNTNDIKSNDEQIAMDAEGTPILKVLSSLNNHKKNMSHISTTNRFQALTIATSKNDSSTSQPRPQGQKSHNQPLLAKQPPIFIYEVENKFNFTRTLSATCQVKQKIQHGKECIRFQLETHSDYEKVTTNCIQAKY